VRADNGRTAPVHGLCCYAIRHFQPGYATRPRA
jgi:hypothetical protein